MRITNTSMIRSHMYDTQSNLSRMNKINEQLNTGKVINRVSDDPHKAVKIMNLNNEIKYTEKYNYNIDETVGWMNNTDSSLEEVGRVLSDIKESMLKVGNPGYSESELKAIHVEMNEKIKELGETLNASHGGRYMFGGTNVDEPPVIISEKDGIVTLSLNPKANSKDLKVDISNGINIDYNVSADEIFGAKRDDKGNITNEGFLGDINKLSEKMNYIANVKPNDEESKKEILGSIKENIDEFFNHALDHRTSLGVRVSTAEKIKELNDENILQMKGVLSLDQDVDHVEKFIELKSAEMIYQASIQVGTKLIQPTIMDYLR